MNDDNALHIFYTEEIRGHTEVANFFLEWLLDDNSYKSTSGNAYFLEKQGDKILIGCLWDDEFEETLVLKEKVISFLKEKTSSTPLL